MTKQALKIIAAMQRKIEELERQLRISEMERHVLQRHYYEGQRESIVRAVKLKREINLLRNSP